MTLAGGYYPDAADWEGRAPVDVFAGTTVSRLDLQLRLRPAFHVRGTLDAGAAHNEHQHVWVVLRSPDGGWDSPAGAVVRPDGTFDVPGVTPGVWLLHVMHQGAGVPNLFHAGPNTAVTVTDRDLNGVHAPALRWFDLSGRIQPAREGVTVRCEPVDDPAESDKQAVTKSDGTFSLTGMVPDRYEVRVTGPVYLKSIRSGSVELPGVEIDLTGGAAGDLELVTAEASGRVDGTIKDSVPVARAVLAAEKGRSRPVSADVDQNGRFSFADLPPGSYRAYAVSNYDEGLWRNADFLALVAERGVPVEVPDKGAAHVEVSMLSAADIRAAEGRVP